MALVRLYALVVCSLLAVSALAADPEAVRVPGETWRGEPSRESAGRGLKSAPREAGVARERARKLLLAPPGPNELDALSESADDARKGLRVGALRRDPLLPATVEDFDWERTAAGGYVSSLLIQSPGAASLRAQFDFRGLPAGAEIRYAQPDTGVAVADSVVIDQRGSRRLWSPSIASDTMLVEIYLPPEVAREPAEVTVLAVMHQTVEAGVDRLRLKDLRHVGNSGSCHIDAACADDEAVNYDTARAATAKVMFVDGDSAFVCTGNLLNDLDGNTQKPWFLTSHHCINSQAAAGSAEFYWFFSRSTCSSGDTDDLTRTTGGAQLLSSDSQTDYSFMRLFRAPPAGAGLAGWTTLQPLNRAAFTLHHPSGDLKKYAEGTTDTRFRAFFDTPRSHTPIVWDRGTTEPGSSGAGLWIRDGEQSYLAGVLTGGFASCSNTAGRDLFGRFDLAYPFLRQWLVAGDDSGMVSEGFVTITGKVRASHDPGLPVTALVLANGQHTFSSDGTYSLTAKLDGEGKLMVFAWADGFRQYEYELYPPGEEVVNDIYMRAEN